MNCGERGQRTACCGMWQLVNAAAVKDTQVGKRRPNMGFSNIPPERCCDVNACRHRVRKVPRRRESTFADREDAFCGRLISFHLVRRFCLRARSLSNHPVESPIFSREEILISVLRKCRISAGPETLDFRRQKSFNRVAETIRATYSQNSCSRR